MSRRMEPDNYSITGHNLFLSTMAESVEVDLEDEYLELPEDDKEGLIRYQFFRGFEYEQIRLFLQKNQP